MTSLSLSSAPSQKSNAKRFGYGYEVRTPNSSSTQTARAEFLKLLLSQRPQVVLKLFAIAIQPFYDLLSESEEVIASLSESLEAEIPDGADILREPKFIRQRAIMDLLPSYGALRQVNGANQLRQSLDAWGFESNLSDEWCLNHALAFLRDFDDDTDRKMALALLNRYSDSYCLRNVINRAWYCAIHNSCDPARAQFLSNLCVAELGVYSFTFAFDEITFSVSGPFFKCPAQFNQEVEENFRKAGGPAIRGARKALEFQLANYRQEVTKAVRELNLEAPRIRWGADHFDWLIDYQIDRMSYREIGRRFKKDEATVREAVKNMAKLMDLTLRSAKRSSRPSGVPETKRRRRATRTAGLIDN